MKRFFSIFAFLFVFLFVKAQDDNLNQLVDSVNTLIKENHQQAIDRFKKIQVKEIFGIKFGSTKDETLRKMKSRYGKPSFTEDLSIYYDNMKYEGVWFDNIILNFQSDGFRSYFNGCIFGIKCKSLSETWEVQKRLANMLDEKYSVSWLDESLARPWFVCGISPLWDDKKQDISDVMDALEIIAKYHGIECDIIDMDDNNFPYSVRLKYGSYDYVKEEF